MEDAGNDQGRQAISHFFKGDMDSAVVIMVIVLPF
jgi:hypothetical protein